MSYNLVAKPDKYAIAAKVMGVDSTDLSQSDLAKKSVERINQIIEHVGLPRRLAALDIPEIDLEEIAKLVSVIAPGLLKVNPRSTSEKDLLELLRKAF
jgi:alcohol dehydrogenase class IV